MWHILFLSPWHVLSPFTFLMTKCFKFDALPAHFVTGMFRRYMMARCAKRFTPKNCACMCVCMRVCVCDGGWRVVVLYGVVLYYPHVNSVLN